MFTSMNRFAVAVGLIMTVGAALMMTGCGGQDAAAPKTDAAPAAAPATAPTGTDKAPATPAADQEKKDAKAPQVKLDINSPATPEGVTHRFFKAFFGGDDATAYSLLTQKAQVATKEKFAAMASDTIKWEVKGVEMNKEAAAVTVKVQDLNEEGKVTTEELVFALRHQEQNWRVAGFFTNGFAVNYEQTKPAAATATAQPAQSTAANATPAPVKVGQNPVTAATPQ